MIESKGQVIPRFTRAVRRLLEVMLFAVRVAAMWRAQVWAGSLALALLGVAPWARAECAKDLDCGGEQICEAGQCVDPAPVATTPPVVTPPPVAPVGPVGPVGQARVTTVESTPLPESPRLERRSTALVVVGSLTTAAGLVGIVVGLLSMESTCHRELADDFMLEHCERSPDYVAYALGGAGLLGGPAMIVIGAKKVPAEPRARLTPWLSPRAGGLTLRLEL